METAQPAADARAAAPFDAAALVGAQEAVRRALDPRGLFNPGKG